MSRTNQECILDYLWSISPDCATNGQVRKVTGIASHQQVYTLTQELMRTRQIRGEQRSREWVFWVDESSAAQFASPGWPAGGEAAPHAQGQLSPTAFEKLARAVLGRHFDTTLMPGQVPGVPKSWDIVSAGGSIIGDAKYFTLVHGQRLPPAKFSVIAEHVWLLEKTGAPTIFLVFGNDQRVPVLWLQRYGKLVIGVEFYFLADDGKLELLQKIAR